MKHPATRELFAYWNDLRGNRSAPERCDIDPAAIRNVIADTFMLDVDLEQKFPFRLAGTRVNGLFESEQKNKAFLDLWRPEERRNIAAILLTVADGASPIVAGSAVTPNGEDESALELLLLPLRHYGRTHSRILGHIRLTSKAPWLGLQAPGVMTLRSLRIIDPTEYEIEGPMPRIAVGQSTSPAPFGDVEPVAQPRPFLRVIQGGL
jgi:Uncharacterized protein conserved in bacteria